MTCFLTADDASRAAGNGFGQLAGGYLFKMFGLPAAAFAIAHSAKPENRAKIVGIMASAALTSFLTGITEPIEFSFLFIAPVLYAIHAVLAGLAYVLTNSWVWYTVTPSPTASSISWCNPRVPITCCCWWVWVWSMPSSTTWSSPWSSVP